MEFAIADKGVRAASLHRLTGEFCLQRVGDRALSTAAWFGVGNISIVNEKVHHSIMGILQLHMEANEELIQSWVKRAKTGDEKAFSNLLKQFRQLIEQNVGSTVVPGHDNDDLRQEFEVTLVEAVNSFEFEREVKFITHLYNQLFYNKNSLIKRYDRDKRKIISHATVSIDAPVMSEGEGYITPEYEDPVGQDGFDQVTAGTLFEYLNQTESNVAELIIQGYDDEQISSELDLSKSDVGRIKRRIKTKMTHSRRREQD